MVNTLINILKRKEINKNMLRLVEKETKKILALLFKYDYEENMFVALEKHFSEVPNTLKNCIKKAITQYESSNDLDNILDFLESNLGKDFAIYRGYAKRKILGTLENQNIIHIKVGNTFISIENGERYEEIV